MELSAGLKAAAPPGRVWGEEVDHCERMEGVSGTGVSWPHHKHTHTHTHARTHARTNTHTRTRAHMHAHVNTHTHPYVLTHTNMSSTLCKQKQRMSHGLTHDVSTYHTQCFVSNPVVQGTVDTFRCLFKNRDVLFSS